MRLLLWMVAISAIPGLLMWSLTFIPDISFHIPAMTSDDVWGLVIMGAFFLFVGLLVEGISSS